MTVTKPKTDNDLEERFQWHKGLDPNHIFPDELEMIKKLRDQIPELEHETDKFIVCFLFARRHNMEDTANLLKKFMKKRAEYEHLFRGHIPSFKYNPFLVDNMLEGGGSVLHPRGMRDKKQRMLRYFLMGQDNPQGRERGETFVALMWQTYYQIESEPVNAWRNGVAIIVDLKGAGLRNIDVSAKGRELTGALQGTFPFRVRSMMVVNGGWLVSALLTAAKIALPKKLYDRIKMMDVSALKDYVPAENLIPEYGGTAEPYDLQDYLEEISKTEEEFFSDGTWKLTGVADGASP